MYWILPFPYEDPSMPLSSLPRINNNSSTAVPVAAKSDVLESFKASVCMASSATSDNWYFIFEGLWEVRISKLGFYFTEFRETPQLYMDCRVQVVISAGATSNHGQEESVGTQLFYSAIHSSKFKAKGYSILANLEMASLHLHILIMNVSLFELHTI